MNERGEQLERLPHRTWDVLVIGGGINGAVSAAALSRRGAGVALVERGDFAGFTSQQSSNLVWGGIKYLETWEFGLVRHLCKSRNELIREYPSSIREIRFLTTVPRGFRYPHWFLWLGAWLYWLIGSGFTRVPRLLSAAAIRRLEPVIDVSGSRGGFEYSDAWLSDNDARFVFGFVRDALDCGCAAANYVEVVGLRRERGLWIARVRDREGSGGGFEIRSRAVVNAAGAFVDRLNDLGGIATRHRHVFSKGIHLIVDRLTPDQRVLAFFAGDGRLFFAIPMGNRTCIGTTDTPVENPITVVTDQDRRFVLESINHYLVPERRLERSDIIAERCGVRPLAIEGEGAEVQDFLQLSRRHVIEVVPAHRHLSIFGGKLTDCVNIGEEVCRQLASLGIGLRKPDAKWFGEPGEEQRRAFFRKLEKAGLGEVGLPAGEGLGERLWRRYGTRAEKLLAEMQAEPALRQPVIRGAPLARVELKEVARREMVVRLEDFLRRRTRISQVIPRSELRCDPGVRAACEILFGDDAAQRHAEYFATPGSVESAGVVTEARVRAERA